MSRSRLRFNSITEALKDFKKGKMIVVVDDPHRENEGDLLMAAEKATPQAINFMARHGRGLICAPMTPADLDRLEIEPMVHAAPVGTGRDTAFAISVDARHGTTTGISAKDRAVTVKRLIHPKSSPADFIRPGHIFPLRAKEGGVLVRAGHTEAAVDFARLAGLKPAGVICEIMNEDGSMARVPHLMRFAKRHRLKIVTILDLIEHRRRTERLVERKITSKLPTRYGEFDLHVYEEALTGKQHLALAYGDVAGKKNVVVRVHSSCLTGDVLFSLRCDCGQQLEAALSAIAKRGRGVLVYLAQEGRGIGLLKKIEAYRLQDQGMDTVEANRVLGFKPDLREYGIGAQILADLGLSTIRILTNNPRKIVGIGAFGLRVTGRIPLEIKPNSSNAKYLKTKRDKLGHLLSAREVHTLSNHFSLEGAKKK